MKKLILLLLGLCSTAIVFSQTLHTGTISADETWFAADNPHLITGNITVDDGVTLTVEPGVEVYINSGRRMLIRGTLDANGTAGSPILFTSNQLIAAPGDWNYIRFDDADAGSIMNYCTVEYGGSQNGMVRVRNSGTNVTISNSTLAYSGSPALRLDNNGADPQISDCVFDNNQDFPINTYADRVKSITGTNTFTGNTPNAINVRSQTITTGTWLNHGVPYYIDGNMTVADLETLTLSPGCTLEVEQSRSFTINGSLIADGTSSERIVFTSLAATPAKGDWGRIYFNNAETSSMSYCDVLYGGAINGAVQIRSSGSNVTITECLIDNSAGYGIYNTTGSTSFISNVTVTNCNNYPIYAIADGVKNITGTLSFSGNTPVEIYVQNSTITTGTWLKHPVDYVLGSGDFTIADGETLTLTPGITMKIDGDRRINVAGTLVADGDMANPITFTSNAGTPAKGDWENLYFNDADAGCILDYCIFNYGGSNIATINMNNTSSNIAISNCSISNSGALGIYQRPNVSANIADCSITDCDDFAIRTSGDNVKSITGVMTITGNTPNAIRVDAQNINSGVWLDHGVPYVMWGDMNVSDANILVLSPGCELQFNENARLQVLGTLVADGDMANTITFTSSMATPAAGDWENIYFNEADAGTVLDYCSISYAGSSPNGAVYVRNSGSNVTISNTLIDNCSNYGIFTNAGSETPISNCTITNCGDYPIRTRGNNVRLITGTMSFTGNTPNAIGVDPQDLFSGSWLDHGVPYVILNDINQLDGNILILNPGVQLNFELGVRLTVFGTLLALGEEANRITFTSNAATPAPGDWERLLFDGADAGTQLAYCDVMYGGGTLGNLDITNSGSNVSIMNTVISNSGSDGVRIRGGSNPSFINCEIINNTESGVYIQGTAEATFGMDETEWNDLYGNGDFELRNGFLDIDAMYVYWGITACGSIGDVIFDQFDNASLGIVNFSPFVDAAHIIPALETTWTGTNSTAWNDDGNWDNGQPCGSSGATIPGGPSNQPVVSSDEECFDLTVEPGGQLTINSGNTLFVRGDLTLEADATGGASLVEDFGLTVNGEIESEVYIEADRWHFVSPTLTEQKAGVFLGMYLYGHDEATNTFVNIVDEETPLEVGVGYEVWSYSTPPPPNPGTTTRSYSGGAINSGTYFFSVTNTGSGWNFLGNPYPSAVDWDDPSWIKSGVDGTVWVWDGTQYLTWNGLIGDLTDGIIPAGQAFFVSASGVSPILAVGNGARRHGASLYKEGEVSDLLQLSVTGNNLNDKTFINFNENATMGYDTLFDSYKLMGLEEAPQMYTFIGEEKIKINTLNEIGSDLIVPMALEVGAETEYTIVASGMQSFDEDVMIYIEDIKEGIMVDLSMQSDYTFMASPEDEAERFNIHFLKSTVNTVEQELSSLQIYSSANSVFVKNQGESLEDATIAIYNISGQKVFEETLQNTPLNRFELNLQSGYYVVKVVSGTALNSEKVFIQ